MGMSLQRFPQGLAIIANTPASQLVEGVENQKFEDRESHACVWYGLEQHGSCYSSTFENNMARFISRGRLDYALC